MRRVYVWALPLILLASCKDEGLVGSWAFNRTDLIDNLVQGVEKAMREAGADEADINAVSLLATVGEGYLTKAFRSTTRFNADGSWADDSGKKGTWSVKGDTLIKFQGTDRVSSRYSIDGSELTLTFEFGLLVQDFREGVDLTEEEQASVDELIAAIRDKVDLDALRVRFFYWRE